MNLNLQSWKYGISIIAQSELQTCINEIWTCQYAKFYLKE